MPQGPDFLLTKILATVGPSTSDVPTLIRLIEEGVRAFRINFSHGSFTGFQKSLDLIREASSEADVPVGVLGDLSGPKIRLGRIDAEGIDLRAGDCVQLTAGDEAAMGRRDPDTGSVLLPINYPKLIEEVQPGHRVLINDGAVRMLAVSKETVCGTIGEEITEGEVLSCQVTVGGKISSAKGVNLPDTHLSAPSLTDWDRECAEWAIDHELDYLALSFVRRAEDILQLKKLLKNRGRDNRAMRNHTRLPIIAKIEKPQAIAELDSILENIEGVMVARGDLGVEMDPAQVPVLQKRIIARAHDFGVPVIVATQMLESMIQQPYATRAEVSDVANAIIDGADAVMLSGETAVGKYPVQAVHMMGRTADITEDFEGNYLGLGSKPPKRAQESRYRTAALAHGVSVIVNDLDARFVVMWSELGGGARYLSQNRLRVPIIAVSSNEAALRQMSLLFGVRPLYMPRPDSPDAFLHAIDKTMLERHWADEGDAIVIADGEPLGTPGVTNKIRIHYVGDVCRVRWHAKGG